MDMFDFRARARARHAKILKKIFLCLLAFIISQLTVNVLSLLYLQSFKYSIVPNHTSKISNYSYVPINSTNEENYATDFYFLPQTRHALKQPTSQVITSAKIIENQCNPKLTFPYPKMYQILKATCNSKTNSNPVVWTFMDTLIKTAGSTNGTFQLRPTIKNSPGKLPLCLTTTQADFLTVGICIQSQQLFAITFKKAIPPKIYFAILSPKKPGKCVDLKKVDPFGEVFVLEPCSDSVSQLFYIEAVNDTKNSIHDET